MSPDNLRVSSAWVAGDETSEFATIPGASNCTYVTPLTMDSGVSKIAEID